MPDKRYELDRPNIPAEVRRVVEVEAGHCCAVKGCGEHTYLEIHHINGDRTDNRVENLILLCDKHHKMAHNGVIDRKALTEYKRLLKEKGGPADTVARLDEIKAMLEEVVAHTSSTGGIDPQLSPAERYSRALREVARLHFLTVDQVEKALTEYVAKIKSDTQRNDYEHALADFASQDYVASEQRSLAAARASEAAIKEAGRMRYKALLLAGDAQHMQLRYEPAVESYCGALSLLTKQELLERVATSWKLIDVLGEVGRTEDALLIATQILDEIERDGGFNWGGVLMALNWVGLTLLRLERYKEAEAYFQRIVTHEQFVKESDTEIAAVIFNNLSSVYRHTGRKSDSEAMDRRVFDIRRKLFGDDHPDVATGYNNIALSAWDCGDLKIAEANLRKAVAINTKYLGLDHPRTLTCNTNLGRLLTALEQFAEAEAILDRCVISYGSIYRSDPSKGHFALQSLGELYFKTKRYDKSEAVFRKILANQLASESVPLRRSLDTRNAIGLALLAQGKEADAEAIFREALASNDISEREGDLFSAIANNLVFLLTRQNRRDDLETLYRDIVTLCERITGETGALTLHALNDLARQLNESGKADQAECVLSELLVRNAARFGHKHISNARLHVNVATILRARNKNADAREHLIIAMELLDASDKDDELFTTITERLKELGKEEENGKQ